MDEEHVCALHLNAERYSQLFTHLLTYLFRSIALPEALQQTATFDGMREVAFRLVNLKGDGRMERVLMVSFQEVETMKEVFANLAPLYEHGEHAEKVSTLAHLAACRTLVEEAEQQARTRPGARGTFETRPAPGWDKDG